VVLNDDVERPPRDAAVGRRGRDTRTHLINPPAFGRRDIPWRGVAPRSNIPGILTRRALRDGRRAALGAAPGL